jgi:hypothetical protein
VLKFIKVVGGARHVLDFLLILGQVPGTKFYVTFTEIVLILIAVTLRYEEKTHRKQIRRWLK